MKLKMKYYKIMLMHLKWSVSQKLVIKIDQQRLYLIVFNIFGYEAYTNAIDEGHETEVSILKGYS